MTQPARQGGPSPLGLSKGHHVEAFRKSRTMQPRPQQGTSLLVALQIVATDEGIYLARLAYRNPEGWTGVAHSSKVMWQGGTEDVEHFAADVAGALQDVIEWTVA